LFGNATNCISRAFSEDMAARAQIFEVYEGSKDLVQNMTKQTSHLLSVSSVAWFYLVQALTWHVKYLFLTLLNKAVQRFG